MNLNIRNELWAKPIYVSIIYRHASLHKHNHHTWEERDFSALVSTKTTRVTFVPITWAPSMQLRSVTDTCWVRPEVRKLRSNLYDFVVNAAQIGGIGTRRVPKERHMQSTWGLLATTDLGLNVSAVLNRWSIVWLLQSLHFLNIVTSWILFSKRSNWRISMHMDTWSWRSSQDKFV